MKMLRCLRMTVIASVGLCLGWDGSMHWGNQAAASSFQVASVAGSLLNGSAKRERVQVQILLGKKGSNRVDPRVKSLASELRKLGFTSVEQIEAVPYAMGANSKTKIRLPGGEWLDLQLSGYTAEGKLHASFSVHRLRFKAKVAIPKGRRVVTRGPSYQGGTLIIAMTRK